MPLAPSLSHLSQTISKTITKLHYGALSKPKTALLFVLLFIPAVFYSTAIRFKNLLYRLKVLKETPVHGLQVICIGNISAGGVGKTPVTIEFCRFLSKKYRTVSLSRGYRGTLKGANIVRDYSSPLINDPKLTGDEVQLISNSSGEYGGYGVMVSKDRLAGARTAFDKLNAEVIVMDDGFSNRKLAKNLTLLLFDVNKFVGNGFTLPLGPLREPFSETKRADGIILIDKEGTEEAKKEDLKDFIKSKTLKPVFFADFRPDYFYDIKTNEIIDKAKITSPFAFSGIGQPQSFYNYLSLELKGFKTSATKSFDDHHNYTEKDTETLVLAAKKQGANCLITTEKDAVKLKNLINTCAMPVLALKLKVDIDVENILNELNFKV